MCNEEEKLSSAPRNKLVNSINKFKELEQNIIKDMNLRIKTLKAKQQDIEDDAEELKLLKSDFTQNYHRMELGDFYKKNMSGEIDNLRHLSEEINQNLCKTSALLRDIQSTSTISKNIVHEKQAKLRSNKKVVNEQIHMLDVELQKLSAENEQGLERFDVELTYIKNKIDEIKAEEDKDNEINITINETADIERQLLLGKDALENKYISDIKSEIENLRIENSTCEEKISEYKTKLSDELLQLERLSISELNLRSLLEKSQNEILIVNEENAKLVAHEVFQLSEEEQITHENIVNQFMQRINKLEDDISSLHRNILEEQGKKEKLIEEITTIEIVINDLKSKIVVNLEQIELSKSKDASKLLKECKQATKETLDQIFMINSEITQLKTCIENLEAKISSIISVSDEDIDAINLDKENCNKGAEALLMRMEMDYQNFLAEHELLKKETEKSTTDKTENIQEHVKEITEKIEKLNQEERNADIILQGNMVECDIFARKLKVARETMENLKREMENFNKPTPVIHKKRSIEEMNDSSISSLLNIKDRIKYRAAKEAKMARRK